MELFAFLFFTNSLIWENWAIYFKFLAKTKSKYLHYVPLHFSFILSIYNSISSQNFAQIFRLVFDFSRLTKFQRIKLIWELSPRWRHFNGFDLNLFIFFEIDWSDTYRGLKNQMLSECVKIENKEKLKIRHKLKPFLGHKSLRWVSKETKISKIFPFSSFWPGHELCVRKPSWSSFLPQITLGLVSAEIEIYLPNLHS